MHCILISSWILKKNIFHSKEKINQTIYQIPPSRKREKKHRYSGKKQREGGEEKKKEMTNYVLLGERGEVSAPWKSEYPILERFHPGDIIHFGG